MYLTCVPVVKFTTSVWMNTRGGSVVSYTQVEIEPYNFIT